MEAKSNLNFVQTSLEPAKLSIIAETSKVVTYFFHMRNFKYLPEEIKVGFDDQKTLLDAARNQKDFDDEDIDQMKAKGTSWDEYKVRLYAKTAQTQYYKRNVNQFKDF